MCRFLGYAGKNPARLALPLLHDTNALRHQSRRDRRGSANADGWGIGTFDDRRPHIIRKPVAAHLCDDFTRVAESLTATHVIAHIRNATVGTISECNTHPFTDGRWILAQNGLMQGFHDRVLPLVRSRVHQNLLDTIITGTTDSEHWLALFRALLHEEETHAAAVANATRNSSAAHPLNLRLAHVADPADPHAATAFRAFCRTAQEIESLALAAHQNPNTESNLILSDGSLMMAVRWRHTLWLRVTGSAPPPRFPAPGSLATTRCGPYDGVTIVSEPHNDEAEWLEVPEFCALLVEHDGSLTLRDLPHRGDPMALVPPPKAVNVRHLAA